LPHIRQKSNKKPTAASVGFGFQGGKNGKGEKPVYVTEENVRTAIKDTRVSVSITKDGGNGILVPLKGLHHQILAPLKDSTM